MTLTKGFLRPNALIDKKKLPLSILLGVGTSFLWYCLFYCFRELHRILPGQLGWELLVELTKEENFYSNLFFGSIASIIGCYATLNFLLETSDSPVNRKHRLRKRHILSEIGFSKWTFILTFTRFTSLLGILYLMVPLQFEINFSKEFWCLLILIPLVFFLNIWPLFIRTVGKEGYRYMFYAFFSVCCLSLIYANLNFLDYKKFNRNFNSKHVEYAYDLGIPATSSSSTIRWSRWTSYNIYIVRNIENPAQPRVFWEDAYTEITLPELCGLISQEKLKLHESELEDLTANLHIDKDVPLKSVRLLTDELRKLNLRRIQYATRPFHTRYPLYYQEIKYSGLPQLLPVYTPDSAGSIDPKCDVITPSRLPENPIQAYKDYQKVEVRIDQQHAYLNGELISKEKLQSVLYNLEKKYSPNFIIIYSPDSLIPYGRYIEYLDVFHLVTEKLRNEMSYELYGEPIDHYYRGDKYQEIWDKYPINIRDEQKKKKD